MILEPYHIPVLLPQVIEGLKVKKGQKYIDATVGGGGYTSEILRLGGIVLGIDIDQDAIDYLKKNYQIALRQSSGQAITKYKVGKDLFLEQGNYRDLKKIAGRFGFDSVAGVLFDLGMSTYQLEKSGRGFSYTLNEPLDMRMNKRSQVTAADILNKYSKDKLYEIFIKFSEELNSGTIATAIARARSMSGSILRTKDLVAIIDGVLRIKKTNQVRNRIQARIFQALRMTVNNELENLQEGLLDAIEVLVKGGRLVVLSYHSLEDRVVKLTTKNAQKAGVLNVYTKSPIRASRLEIATNPKSASAKLRISEKLK